MCVPFENDCSTLKLLSMAQHIICFIWHSKHFCHSAKMSLFMEIDSMKCEITLEDTFMALNLSQARHEEGLQEVMCILRKLIVFLP